jgi:hypothetical protein
LLGCWISETLYAAKAPAKNDSWGIVTTIAVCAIFKDEGPALLEWIAYHRAVGVDHFFLYDNESTDEGTSILLSSYFKEHVTVIPIPSRPAQLPAYKHFISSYAKDWDWAAFIDLDEFIHPIKAESIKDLMWKYSEYSGVLLHWLTFGPNGHDRRPEGLVIENYTRRLPESLSPNQHVKSLVRTIDLVGEPGVHVFDTRGPLCNSRGEPAPRRPIQDGVCHDVICINHYYTKSREDWNAKLRRGRADAPQFDRQEAWFDEYARLCNITDERITRFSSSVKKSLACAV